MDTVQYHFKYYICKALAVIALSTPPMPTPIAVAIAYPNTPIYMCNSIRHIYNIIYTHNIMRILIMACSKVE